MNRFAFKQNRGDLTIYIALILSFIMITSAVILSMTLSKQIRLTKNVENSERAFYAANTGIEEAYYIVGHSVIPDPEAGFDLNGELDYGTEGVVKYGGHVSFIPGSGICIERMTGGANLTGASHGEQRRLATGCGTPASLGTSNWTGAASSDWNGDNWDSPPASEYDVVIEDDGNPSTPIDVVVDQENNYNPALNSILIKAGTFTCNKKLNFKTITVQGNNTKFIGSSECPLSGGKFLVADGATLSAKSITGDTLTIGGH